MQLIIKTSWCKGTEVHEFKSAICSIRNIFCFFVLLIYSVNAFSNGADSTVKTKIYHVNYPVVGVIIAGGLLSDYFAISRIKNKTAISPAELIFLNSDAQRKLINPIDRWALTLKASDRPRYQNYSNYGMVSIILLPGLLAIDKDIRKDWLDLLLIYTEGHTITFTFYNYSFLGPTFQNRYRQIISENRMLRRK